MKKTKSIKSIKSMNLFRISLTLFISLMVCFSASNLTAATNQPAKASQPVLDSKTIQPNSALYEFTYTLAFAKKLGFTKIANLIEKQDYTGALIALDAKTASNFKWSQEAIDGYQYGFFSEALKGICLEKNGEVVKAYRAYQNARQYCDEEKALQYPAPKLEVWTAIGRMCNAAGRYTDSENYLVNARMQAAEYPLISASSDRALLNRARQLGELEEMNFLFSDLYDLGSFKKEDYSEYAQIKFRIGEDRVGYKIIFDGIQNAKGENDDLNIKETLMQTFFQNFVRVEEQEIMFFYDLLGSEIQNARMLKGDEKYIVGLIHARKMLSKFYDYLVQDEDLEKVRERIAKLENTPKPKFLSNDQNLIQNIQKKQKRIIKKTGKLSSKLDVGMQVEDLVMVADRLGKLGKYAAAILNYQIAYSNMNVTMSNILYDDTTIKNAIEVGNAICNININRKYVCDFENLATSLRGNILGILIYRQMTNKLDASEASYLFFEHPFLKVSNPIYYSKGLLMSVMNDIYMQGGQSLIVEFIENAVSQDKGMYNSLQSHISRSYLWEGQFNNCAEKVLEAQKYIKNIRFIRWQLVMGWCNIDQIKSYYTSQKDWLVAQCAIQEDLATSYSLLLDNISMQNSYSNYFNNIFTSFRNKDNSKVLDLYQRINRKLFYNESMGWIKSSGYLDSGKYANANDNIKYSIKARESQLQIRTLRRKIPLAPQEINIINTLKNNLSSKELEWLKEYQ